jgi:hypothetical protein
MLDKVEGLHTVDVFDKYISEGYEHLEVKICKERMWKLCVFRYELHIPVLLQLVTVSKIVMCHLGDLQWSR